jgi:hypothetical protein
MRGFGTLLRKSYTKVLDVGENLIVESEVIAGNDINAGLLLNIPVLKTKSLGLAEELSLGELATPVSFCCLLQVTIDSHTRETENRSAMKTKVSILQLQISSAKGGTHD